MIKSYMISFSLNFINDKFFKIIKEDIIKKRVKNTLNIEKKIKS